jgi:hypothetical protein
VEPIFDMTDESLTASELAEVNETANRFFCTRRKWALYSTLAFAASCGLVAPFLAGNPLHRYWNSIGRNLLILPMVLLLIFVWQVGLFWSA